MPKEIRKDAVVVYMEGNPITGNPLVGQPEYALEMIGDFISNYKENCDVHVTTVVVTHSYKIAWDSVDMLEERLAFIMSDSHVFAMEVKDASEAPVLWALDIATDYSLAFEQLRIINERDEKKRKVMEASKIS